MSFPNISYPCYAIKIRDDLFSEEALKIKYETHFQ